MNRPSDGGLRLVMLPEGAKLIAQLEQLDDGQLSRWIVEQGGAWSVLTLPAGYGVDWEATVQLRGPEGAWMSERETGDDRRSALIKALRRLLPRLG